MDKKLAQMISLRPAAKRCVIWKKTSTCRSVQGLRRYIAQYLDETQKEPSESGMPTAAAKPASLRAGIDYLTKKEKGDVHIFGFLRPLIEAETSRSIDQLTNQEKAEAAEVVWKRLLKAKNLKKAAHKIVIALDPEICEMMTMARLPVDEELLRITRIGFDQYRGKFYPGQELGYLVGLHHDRAHIHAHIMLYPQTAEGKPLNVSHDSKVTLDNGKVVRVDYQGVLKTTFERLATNLYRTKIVSPNNPRELPEDYQIHPRILTAAVHEDIKGTPEPNVWEKVREKRAQQDLLVAPQETAIYLSRALENRVDRVEKISIPHAEARLPRALEERRAILGEMAARARRIRKVGRPSSQDASRGLLFKDVFRVRRIFLGARRFVWALPHFGNDPEGKWYLERMKRGDRLGRFMQVAFDKIAEATQTSKAAELFRELRAQRPQRRGSGYLPDFVPLTWKRRRQVIDEQLSDLRQLEKQRLKEIHHDLADMKRVKNLEIEALIKARLRLQVVDLEIVDLQARKASKLPRYLLEYQMQREFKKPIRPALTGSGNQSNTASAAVPDDIPMDARELANYLHGEDKDDIVPPQAAEEIAAKLKLSKSPAPPFLTTPIPKSESPDLARLRSILAGNLSAIWAATSSTANDKIGKVLQSSGIETDEELASLEI